MPRWTLRSRSQSCCDPALPTNPSSLNVPARSYSVSSQASLLPSASGPTSLHSGMQLTASSSALATAFNDPAGFDPKKAPKLGRDFTETCQIVSRVFLEDYPNSAVTEPDTFPNDRYHASCVGSFHPPDYSVLAPRIPSAPIHPRHNEGQEALPDYQPTVYREGLAQRKLELLTPYLAANQRSWGPVYIQLNNTQLNIYSVIPKRAEISLFPESSHNDFGLSYFTKTSQDSTPLREHEDKARSPVNATVCNGQYRISKILRSYTLQYAEIGSANDYSKRSYVLRLRVEAEQFLLQLSNAIDYVAWVNAIQSAIDVSLPLDERPLPKTRLIPRRSRRNRNQQPSRLLPNIESTINLANLTSQIRNTNISSALHNQDSQNRQVPSSQSQLRLQLNANTNSSINLPTSSHPSRMDLSQLRYYNPYSSHTINRSQDFIPKVTSNSESKSRISRFVHRLNPISSSTRRASASLFSHNSSSSNLNNNNNNNASTTNRYRLKPRSASESCSSVPASVQATAAAVLNHAPKSQELRTIRQMPSDLTVTLTSQELSDSQAQSSPNTENNGEDNNATISQDLDSLHGSDHSEIVPTASPLLNVTTSLASTESAGSQDSRHSQVSTESRDSNHSSDSTNSAESQVSAFSSVSETSVTSVELDHPDRNGNQVDNDCADTSSPQSLSPRASVDSVNSFNTCFTSPRSPAVPGYVPNNNVITTADSQKIEHKKNILTADTPSKFVKNGPFLDTETDSIMLSIYDGYLRSQDDLNCNDNCNGLNATLEANEDAPLDPLTQVASNTTDEELDFIIGHYQDGDDEDEDDEDENVDVRGLHAVYSSSNTETGNTTATNAGDSESSICTRSCSQGKLFGLIPFSCTNNGSTSTVHNQHCSSYHPSTNFNTFGNSDANSYPGNDQVDSFVTKWVPEHPKESLKLIIRCIKPLPAHASWTNKIVILDNNKYIVKKDTFVRIPSVSV